jgi:cellulose synthase/poly-beta-1,6-N-acetylglucosamine synthase-like glycosyltransferase
MSDLDGPPSRQDASRARIGAILVSRGALREDQLLEALRAQQRTAARLGDVVSRRGLASARDVAGAAAEQAGRAFADLGVEPLDPAIGDPKLLAVCLEHGMAPWRREGSRLRFVAGDVVQARRGLRLLGIAEQPDTLAICDAETIAQALAAAHPDPVAQRAADRAPEMMSVRRRDRPMRRAGLALACLLAALLWFWPMAGLAALFAAALLMNALNAVLRVAALDRALRARPDPRAEVPEGALSLTKRLKPRKFTILVPLYHEADAAPVILDALTRLDWPPELLDVKLITEADDQTTRDTLRALNPPPYCQILTAPPGGPRTKPKALNFALDFAEGDVIGVYDAEDRPEPDQLRRVDAILRDAPPEVACVQARLSYYNVHDSWLTRCFTIEYAIWFDVLLGGYRDLGLPLPLGGTSVFFRREALMRLGGWDAHNVTEDADLGMRLARMGYRCEVTGSTTYEEASSRPVQWIRQRSRWLKGYLATWLTHMRRPARLWREMGPRGFLGFQAIFLGAFAAYLGMPLFWAVWGLSLAGFAPAFAAQIPDALLWSVAAVQLIGWAAMLVAAFAATERRGARQLWPWIPTLLVYWPMGAVAAWIAVAELILAPTLWRKTRHGLGPGPAAARAEAVDRLSSAAPAPRRAGAL